MATTALLDGKNVISSKLAEIYYIENGKRVPLMNAISLTATFKANKIDVPILGTTGVGHKIAGWSGTGTMQLYYASSKLRKDMATYATTGIMPSYDLYVKIEDPTTDLGVEACILKGVTFDEVCVAKFDANGDLLNEDLPFTFESFSLLSEFNEIPATAGSNNELTVSAIADAFSTALSSIGR